MLKRLAITAPLAIILPAISHAQSVDGQKLNLNNLVNEATCEVFKDAMPASDRLKATMRHIFVGHIIAQTFGTTLFENGAVDAILQECVKHPDSYFIDTVDQFISGN